MHPNHVLIVDDHPIVLYGLRFLIEQSSRFAIAGEAGDADAARAKAAALQPGYVVLDLVLGGRDGIDLVRDILAAAPSARILVYSSQSEWRFARRVLQAGARGFVAKGEGLLIVGEALDVLAAGETFLSVGLQRRLLADFVAGEGPPGERAHDLSERELQVLRLIGTGAATGEIGAALGISAKTVGTYRDRLKAKLGAVSARALDELARAHVSGE